MSSTEWHVVDDESQISFVFGCECRAHGRGKTWDLPCAAAGYAHGHARVSSKDDGDCWLPFPVASQEGMRFLMVACADWLSAEERAAFLALPAVRLLPTGLIPGESAIINDPATFMKYHRYAFVA